MAQQIFTPKWSRNGESIPIDVTITTDASLDWDVVVPGNTADLLVAAAIDVSQMKSLFIHSDVDVTIETNSSSSPGNTITVKANRPVQWYVDGGIANPLTTDVTAFYITRGSAGDALVKIRIMVDATV